MDHHKGGQLIFCGFNHPQGQNIPGDWVYAETVIYPNKCSLNLNTLINEHLKDKFDKVTNLSPLRLFYLKNNLCEHSWHIIMHLHLLATFTCIDDSLVIIATIN